MARRKDDYLQPDKLILIEGMARNGAKIKEIAARLGITERTLINWKNKHPEIREAINRGKEVVDFEVENALLKSARGYEYTEATIDAKGNKKVVRKKVAPNVIAQIFWLKNRRPDRWRDQVDAEISGALPVVIKDDIKE